MKKMKQKIDFDHFVEKFPVIELPLVLTEEAQHIFSKTNDPLPPLMIEQFILPLEAKESDEYTEFVACFRLPGTPHFHALVYWRAGLLEYYYTLATFTKKGVLIDKKMIAGTKVDGKLLVKSVATFDEDWVIYVVGGVANADQSSYDASSSQSITFELLADGKIITTN